METESSQEVASSFDLHLTQTQIECESQETILDDHCVKSPDGSSVAVKVITEGEMPCEPLHFVDDIESRRSSYHEMLVEENICETESENKQSSRQETKDVVLEEKTMREDEQSCPEVVIISPSASAQTAPSQSILEPLATTEEKSVQQEKKQAAVSCTGIHIFFFLLCHSIFMPLTNHGLFLLHFFVSLATSLRSLPFCTFIIFFIQSHIFIVCFLSLSFPAVQSLSCNAPFCHLLY